MERAPVEPREGHVPVMGKAVARGLALSAGRRYLDCTYGLGGYTRQWLSACDCQVIAQPPSASAANLRSESGARPYCIS